MACNILPSTLPSTTFPALGSSSSIKGGILVILLGLDAGLEVVSIVFICNKRNDVLGVDGFLREFCSSGDGGNGGVVNGRK